MKLAEVGRCQTTDDDRTGQLVNGLQNPGVLASSGRRAESRLRMLG
jgi:hypothetical protein